MSTKVKLAVLNFLQFAVWGAYLTSMGTYLARVGMAGQIGWFYSVQGFVSLCMPALMGIVADRWIEAQRLLSLCHLASGAFMLALCLYGLRAGEAVQFGPLFTLYTLSVAFFMPTIALSYSVAYSALGQAGLETVKVFPPIRVFGTVGFIASMWVVDLGGMQSSPLQFGWSGLLGLVLAAYALSMPHCPTSGRACRSVADTLGLRAFALFRDYRMALFFIFSMLLGVCLQITNSFANLFITSFGNISQFCDTFGVRHANILISLSQASETLCILLIPYFLRRFGIKRVMLLAMLAWALRYLFFAIGNPGSGVGWFVLSMIVYGIAFDFFHISGSLFLGQVTGTDIRSSAQGLFMMMTNGFGATVGTLSAQQVVNHYVLGLGADADPMAVWRGWTTCWYIFAGYSLVLAVAFAILFRYRHQAGGENIVKEV